MTYIAAIERHYAEIWGVDGMVCPFSKGPVDALPEEFAVLRFPPHGDRTMWTYATRGMSLLDDAKPVELHVFAPHEADGIVEILYAVAYYHRTGARLDLDHSVNFGKPWIGHSQCTYGLISLPYLDGPDLELLHLAHGTVHFYWLIPITAAEVAYKKQHGMEALESKFEEVELDYLDPNRASAV